MRNSISIGFPLMHLEKGEKRDFLPTFMKSMHKYGFDLFLEHGYGAGMGFSESDYEAAAPGITFTSNAEVYQKDIVIVLRYPGDKAVAQMKAGGCLIAMLHYPTRPQRVQYLKDRGLEGISLDSIKDDVGRRLIENLRSVAWNGLEIAFELLKKIYPEPGFDNPERLPIKVTTMGAGAVGLFAVQAAIRYGNNDLWHQMAEIGATGVQVSVVDYDLTNHPDILQKILKYTDILVDATQRPETSSAVVPNEWIGTMRPHAILVDLSVDPYVCEGNRVISTKGMEGVPQGTLDQYVFAPDDPAFDKLPECINTTHRRHVVSCYSWPGIHPEECMDLYGKQLSPILHEIANAGGVEHIRGKGNYFQRAISRALLSLWEQ